MAPALRIHLHIAVNWGKANFCDAFTDSGYSSSSSIFPFSAISSHNEWMAGKARDVSAYWKSCKDLIRLFSNILLQGSLY